MPATYDAIATTTLGATSASITFSSISSAYTDLRLVLVGTANGTEEVHLRFNGNTSALYSWTQLLGNGTAASSNTATTQNSARVSGLYFRSGSPALIEIDVLSYAGGTNKTFLSRGTDDRNGNGNVGVAVGLWRSTAAINSITVMMRPGTVELFNAGTTATLYGILRA